MGENMRFAGAGIMGGARNAEGAGDLAGAGRTGGAACSACAASADGHAGRKARRAALVAGLGLAGLLSLPSGALAVTTTTTTTETVNYTKEQAVYVQADAQGSTEGVYVVNAVNASRDGYIEDSGKYTSVENLTDEQRLKSRLGKVSFEAQADETFYYQGNLGASTELPWTVSVTYWLDGKEVDPADLGGANGHLKMELTIDPVGKEDDDEDGQGKADEGDKGDKDTSDSTGTISEDDLADFAQAYLLQVSATLAADEVSELEADSATRATSGDDVQLSYMVFPGKSADFVVEADVTDFAFDGWQIVGVPLALTLDVDSSDISTDSMDSVSQLKDAAVELDDGASELASGAAEVDDGAASLSEGATSLQDGVSQLSEGVDTLVGSGTQLTEASGEVDEGLGQLRDVAVQLNDALANLPDPGDGSVTALQTYAQTLSVGLATLDTKYDDLNQGISDYTAGVGQLKEGVASVSDGADQLAEGAASLSEGTSSLKDGANELADGTGELRSETADIDTKIADGVTEGLTDYLNPDFTERDFVSGEEGHVTRVQFVIKTAAIEQDDDEDDEDTSETKDQTFWEKLLALFE